MIQRHGMAERISCRGAAFDTEFDGAQPRQVMAVVVAVTLREDGAAWP
jgi:hypothetical protein